MATEGGRSWERVKGTLAMHPNPILAAYIDRQTARVNALLTQRYPDDHEKAGELIYTTRRQARRAAQR